MNISQNFYLLFMTMATIEQRVEYPIQTTQIHIRKNMNLNKS